MRLLKVDYAVGKIDYAWQYDPLWYFGLSVDTRSA